MLLGLLVWVSLVQCGMSYESFQARIPNGDSVPYPCKPGKTWPGVGHLIFAGTGTRNPFGRDFELAGYQWTEELCWKDSDGDGLYNGLELGDPYCMWEINMVPNTNEGLSHPGICDPWDSMECSHMPIISLKYSRQEDWLKEMCVADGFECAALSDPSIRNFTARLTPTAQIPPQITTYQCQLYDLYALGVPRDQDFHMVAVTPVIDNTNVVHHIVLFGCTDNTVVPDGPFECGMKPSPTCMEFLHVWTVGLSGECYHPDSGIKIGKTGLKVLATQLHWNNAEASPGLTDSSGLQMYYTPKLKPFDAGVFLVGSVQFYLPPKQQEVTVYSSCGGGCTRQILKGPINITAAWNHMHFAGKSMQIEIKREAEHRTYLTQERTFSYDSPQVQLFTKPVEVFPGDSMYTVCGFNTTKRNKTITWGDATLDEMCFGFLTFYPKQNVLMPYCLDSLGVSMCDPTTMGACGNLGKFLKEINSTDVFNEVTSNCRILSPCLQECVDTIVKYMKIEPCMNGNIWEFIQGQLTNFGGLGQEFLSRIASCKTEAMMALTSPTPPPPEPQQTTDGAAETTTTLYLMCFLTTTAIIITIATTLQF